MRSRMRSPCCSRVRCRLVVLVASSLLVPSVHAGNGIEASEVAGDLDAGIDEDDPAEPTEKADEVEEAEDDDAEAGAEAAEEPPLVEVEGSFTLEYERIEPRDDASARVSDAFATLDADIIVNVAPNAWLGVALGFEPVIDPARGEDRFFEDYGLVADELYAGLQIGAAEMQIGKIAPTFGWAADDAPGLYGGEIAGGYE